MALGTARDQRSVDLYVGGEDIPLEEVQKAWRNTVGLIGPQSAVVARFYEAVRETNIKRRGKHQMRILCGDPSIDWAKSQNNGTSPSMRVIGDDWYVRWRSRRR